jgi:hypothetical protein
MSTWTDLLLFGQAVFWLLVSWIMGSCVMAAVAVWFLLGKTIRRRVALGLIAMGVLWAFFAAWQEEHRAKEVAALSAHASMPARHLTETQREQIAASLHTQSPGRILLAAEMIVPDAAPYAFELATFLDQLGWAVSISQVKTLRMAPRGLWVQVRDPHTPPPDAVILHAALQSAQISAPLTRWPNDEEVITFWSSPIGQDMREAAEVILWIGANIP